MLRRAPHALCPHPRQAKGPAVAEPLRSHAGTADVRRARWARGGAGEVRGCDDRSPVHADTPAGLASHVPDLGYAALPALAHAGGALAAADRPPAEPRHLRGPRLGERHTVHDVGDSTGLPPPAPHPEPITRA